jgi:SAM-dependent methyltransferase
MESATPTPAPPLGLAGDAERDFDLSRRSRRPEALDGPEVSPPVYERCVRELAVANRVTRAHAPTLAWLEQVTAACPPSRPVTLLDVGCGHGDLLRAIGRWARTRGLPMSLRGLDLNPRSAAAARAATPGTLAITFETGDVFAHRPSPRPDFIVCSQFAHHLDDERLPALLRWLEAHAARGWHVCDLERHPVAFHTFPLLCRLARWHPIMREDGVVSIARAFRRADWVALLQEAQVRGEVRSHVPFRLSVSGGGRGPNQSDASRSS